jgi:hypothetical protein
MPSSYSSSLKIELMATGENSGTWGTNTNTNLGTAMEQAVIGYGNIDYVSDANLTISITNSNASQASRCLVLNVTSVFGALTATRELIVPTSQKQYIVQNNTTGGQSITVKTSAGTGITVPNARKAHLYVDGTNVIQMFDFVDINGGAIDGTPIGASSASTGAFSTLNASGATTLDGTVALGNASGDLITVPGTINSNLLFTDATYDIGASGATRPRDLFLSRNLTVGGTLTLTGGVNLNGNVTVGDSSADTLTINSTITSNLIFTDNTYDIGASGATRPRNLYLAGTATIGGNTAVTGTLSATGNLTSPTLQLGTNPAGVSIGVLGIPNQKRVYGRNAANSADVNILYVDGSNGLVLGPSDAAVIDSSGNLGLGIAPGAWSTAYSRKAFQFGPVGSINSLSASTTNNQTYIGSNIISESGGPARIYADWCSLYLQYAGIHTWQSSTTQTGAVSMSDLMTLDASGNLGIGTTSPGQKLVVRDVNKIVDGIGNVFFATTDSQAADLGASLSLGGTYVGTSAYSFAAIAGRKTNSTSSDASGYLAMYTTNPSNTIVERARIDSSGNLLLGGTLSNARLTVGTSDATAVIASGGSNTFLTLGAMGADGAIIFKAGGVANGNIGTERARIDPSGNFLMGKTALNALVGTSIDANTSTGQGIRVVSSSTTTSADGFQMYSTGAAAYRFYVSFNGTISATTTTISAISDIRYKENVRDLDAGLAEVMALKPRKFDWKEGKGADIKNARGFIAQEFETVFPDLIDEWKDPAPEGEDPYKSVRQDLIPVLVKAIQEQQAIITQLTARITALEGA